MTSSSPVDFGGLTLPVGKSEWIIAEFTIHGIAVGFTVKGGGTGCRNLEDCCCELRVTSGIDENVALVWALSPENIVVTTFSRLETASAEELLSITVLKCNCKYSCIQLYGSSSSGRSRS